MSDTQPETTPPTEKMIREAWLRAPGEVPPPMDAVREMLNAAQRCDPVYSAATEVMGIWRGPDRDGLDDALYRLSEALLGNAR